MKKAIRYFKYKKMFKVDAKKLEKLITDTFKTDFNRKNPTISVRFRFGRGEHFSGKIMFGVIRVDYQDGGWIKGFYTLKQYFEMRNKLHSA